MRTFRNAIWVGLAIGGVATAACSSQSPQATPGTPSASSNNWGRISAELQLAPGVTLSAVTYTITNSTIGGFTTLTGSVDVSNSQGIGFSLALPAGDGYAVSLSATDSNGDSCAGGPASFSVIGGQVVMVGLTLTCTGAGDGGLVGPDVNPGTVIITADASLGQTMTAGSCAAVSSLVASVNRIDVGHSIPLTAVGVDPSFQSSDVTLTWAETGTAGSLAGTTGTSNTFSCTSPGNETVTVTAAISGGGASCPGTGSLTVALECDAPLGGSDAGPDTSTSEPDASEGPDAAEGPDASGVAEAGLDSSPMEAAAEASTPEASTPDAGTGGGPPSACTTAPCSANQVTCSNNAASTGGVCTATEAAFVNLDLAAGATTAAGDATTNPNSCYACLVSNHCLDVGTHFTGRECEDLTGNFTNATASVPAAATCDAVVSCVTASSCAVSDSSFCYCGTGGGPSTQCVTAAGGAAANGPCITQEVAGLPDPQADTSDNVGTFYGTKADPSGLANDIFACATTNSCTQCL